MGQIDTAIGEQIGEMVDKRLGGRLRFPVMSGKVEGVDEGEMTAKVLLSTDDDSAPTEGVALNVTYNTTTGVYMVPAKGADCLVAEVDGPGKWELLKASKYSKVSTTVEGGATMVVTKDAVTMKVGTAEITATKEGKVTIKNDAVDLGAVLKDVVEAIMKISVPTPAGTSGPPINIADFGEALGKLNGIF